MQQSQAAPLNAQSSVVNRGNIMSSSSAIPVPLVPGKRMMVYGEIASTPHIDHIRPPLDWGLVLSLVALLLALTPALLTIFIALAFLDACSVPLFLGIVGGAFAWLLRRRDVLFADVRLDPKRIAASTGLVTMVMLDAHGALQLDDQVQFMGALDRNGQVFSSNVLITARYDRTLGLTPTSMRVHGRGHTPLLVAGIIALSALVFWGYVYFAIAGNLGVH